MDEKDKINILFEEYKSLRTEILQRNTVLNNVFTVAGTITAGTAGIMVQYRAYCAGAAVIFLLTCLVCLALFLVDHDSRAASLRIQEIEADINRRSGGERLLCWETENGLPIKGYGARANSLRNMIVAFFKRK
jgi:hypothetical protein